MPWEDEMQSEQAWGTREGGPQPLHSWMLQCSQGEPTGQGGTEPDFWLTSACGREIDAWGRGRLRTKTAPQSPLARAATRISL